jgi:predicted nucleic acid-binding protein
VTVVVDASLVAAALLESGSVGDWALDLLGTRPVTAPHLLPVEVASVLRRQVAAGALPADTAALAHAELLRLPIQLFAYLPLGERVWSLRANLSSYDAWYVALAEELDAPLATADQRLARAPGARCRFLMPPAA